MRGHQRVPGLGPHCPEELPKPPHFPRITSQPLGFSFLLQFRKGGRGCFPNCLLECHMHRRLCLDPADSSEPILPSPSSSLCCPPPATPSFFPRGQSVSKAQLSPLRKVPPLALQARPSSKVAVPGCGTLHPHTQAGVCLQRWQRIQEPVWPGLCPPPAGPSLHTPHTHNHINTHKVYGQPTEHLLSLRPF